MIAQRVEGAIPDDRIVDLSFVDLMDDPVAIRSRDLTGLDCLMWGNDYPHQEGVFPDSQEWVEKQFAGVPEPEIMHIVHDNAAHHHITLRHQPFEAGQVEGQGMLCASDVSVEPFGTAQRLDGQPPPAGSVAPASKKRSPVGPT